MTRICRPAVLAALLTLAITPAAAEDGLDLLGVQMTGAVAGAWAQSLKACDQAEQADQLLAKMAGRLKNPDQLAAFQKGLAGGTSMYRKEHGDAGITAEECAKFLENLQHLEEGKPPTKEPESPWEGQTLEGCSAVTPADDRLACYDSMAAREFPGTDDEGRVGSWEVETLDRVNIRSIRTQGEGSLIGRYQTRPVELGIRCYDMLTEMMLSFDGEATPYMDWGETLSLSVDDGPKVTMEWHEGLASRSTVVFYPRDDLIPFLQGLASSGAKSLTIETQVPPGPEPTVSVPAKALAEAGGRSDVVPPSVVTFDLTGLDDALQPIAQNCRWR